MDYNIQLNPLFNLPTLPVPAAFKLPCRTMLPSSCFTTGMVLTRCNYWLLNQMRSRSPSSHSSIGKACLMDYFSQGCPFNIFSHFCWSFIRVAFGFLVTFLIIVLLAHSLVCFLVLYRLAFCLTCTVNSVTFVWSTPLETSQHSQSREDVHELNMECCRVYKRCFGFYL